MLSYLILILCSWIPDLALFPNSESTLSCTLNITKPPSPSNNIIRSINCRTARLLSSYFPFSLILCVVKWWLNEPWISWSSFIEEPQKAFLQETLYGLCPAPDRKSLQWLITSAKNIIGTIYRASMISVMWDVCTEPAQPVCSPCCLTNDTEVAAAAPPDYGAASFLRLWESSTQHLPWIVCLSDLIIIHLLVCRVWIVFCL